MPTLGEGITEATVTKIWVQKGQKVSAEEPLIDLSSGKVDSDVKLDFGGTITEIFVAENDVVLIGAPLLSIETELIADDALPPKLADATAFEFSTKKPSKVAQLVAKDLGVEINDVIKAVPEDRRVLKKDVANFVKSRIQTTFSANIAPTPLPDFSIFGAIETVPLSGIGKSTAKHLSQIWASVPHAWMLEKADITDLERHRQEAKQSLANLSWTAIYVKTVVGVLKQFPRCNASFDAAGDRIILKKYYHIGVAVDTPKGLVVPVVRDADRKSLAEIAAELEGFAKRAKDESTGFSQQDLTGHTFSISNVGMFGSTGILPIVHAPDSAILGLTSAKKEVVWDETTLQAIPRLMLPMTLGFDHRVVNGAEASKFLATLKKVIEGPVLNLM